MKVLIIYIVCFGFVYAAFKAYIKKQSEIRKNKILDEMERSHQMFAVRKKSK